MNEKLFGDLDNKKLLPSEILPISELRSSEKKIEVSGKHDNQWVQGRVIMLDVANLNS